MIQKKVMILKTAIEDDADETSYINSISNSSLTNLINSFISIIVPGLLSFFLLL